jgi:hypothetical protein
MNVVKGVQTGVLGFALLLAAPLHAAAQTAGGDGGSETPANPSTQIATPPPAPYSIPWQLRPAIAVSVVRSDTAIAFYEDQASNRGTTVATMLLGSYKVTPELAPFVRLGLVGNSPPIGAWGTSFVNPALGATYALKLWQDFRLALFLGLTIPVGMGGGDSPDQATATAARSGILARSAMDNAMFAVNDFAVFPGVGFAYVAHGLTVQAEATVFQLTRVRGENVQPDSSKTNFTSGLHLGYFVIPQLSLGGELRYQRWLSTPSFVGADATGSLRDTLSVALGARFHWRIRESMWLRPGLAYARGLDDPMSKQRYNVVQVDVPFVF